MDELNGGKRFVDGPCCDGRFVDVVWVEIACDRNFAR